ncbi:MAG: 50S ribosomal protein L5 [Verrucomicrobia bacterium]|jgi:large subunit ribosomal protein L5|nr:50S ribosomal protein L5 [Verrucomicrobiota bacterium]
MSTMKEKYKDEVVPALKEKLSLTNPLTVPRVAKVVVNMGTGAVDKDTLKQLTEELATITGQKAQVTKARKSISNFKLREGMSIGAKVTLRHNRMYDFLDRLINAALPRIRDFRGVSATGFDGQGNYTLGLKEQTIFPEIDPNHTGAVQGMNITIVTTAKSADDARELLTLMGMPFATN